MTTTNLPSVQEYMIRYGMTVYFAFGLVGNACNCIMFTRHSYRRIPSCIYFLALSIFAIIYLIWSVVPLLYSLNYSDPQKELISYCKLRLYVTHVLGQCNRYIVVFACVDRYFVTQTNVRIRLLSSVRMATKLVLIICPVWMIAAIHAPILMEIRGGVCGMFGVYKLIYAIYQITLSGILPPVLMGIFSTLTVRSLRQRHVLRIRAREKDRYFTRMVIAEVVINIFTSLPHSANLIYGAITYNIVDKSPQRIEIELFLNFLAQFCIYLLNVAPFYLFLITSRPFRIEFINILIKCWKKSISRQTRISPSNDQINTATTNGRIIYER